MIFRGTSFSLVGSRNEFEGVVATNYIVPDQIYKTEAENRLRSPDRVVIGGGVIPNPDKNSPYKWASNLSMRLEPRKVEDIRKWKDVALITTEKSDTSKAEPAPVDTKAGEVNANEDAVESDDSNGEASTTGTADNTDNQEIAS